MTNTLSHFAKARTLATSGLFSLAACTSAPQGWEPPRDDPDGWSHDEVAADNVPQDPSCPGSGGITYERPRPNVMFLVDRSGSMAEPGPCADATCASKWDQLLALGTYLGDVKSHARLGLSVFPSPGAGGCSVTSGLMVPLTEVQNADTLILDALARVGPDGRTPIPQALDELAASGDLSDPDRENVIVLLTDGMPNCACTDDEACEQARALEAVDRLVTRGVPIKLHVVGFGASAAAAGTTLALMAQAAGTGLPDAPGYYQAETIEELIGRLYQLAANLSPCRFNLDQWPEPEDLVVHLDNGLVAPCTTGECASGYSYDQSTGVVELEGASCQAIRDGACHDVWFETDGTE